MPRECLKIIESKSKVRQSRAKVVVAKIGTSSSTPAISSNVAELKDMVKALLLDKKNQSPALTPSFTPALVKAIEPNCVTCGGAHSYQNCPATNENAYRDNIQEYVSQAAAASYNQGNTGFQPQVNQAPIYQAPIPQTQRVSQIDFESYVKANDAILRNMQSQGQSMLNHCQNIQNQNQNLQIQMAALTEMMSKLVSSNTASSSGSGTLPGMDECLALANLGASINLISFSVWEALSLSELTSTCMTLKLADRSVSKPIGIAKDVSFKTGRALIDMHKGELTLRIRKESITYNLDQTVRYLANYDQITANKIDVICKIYSQEVLGFFDVTASGNPTPDDDPIVSTTSLTLTPFGDSDFLLFEEANAFLGLEDDSDSPKINLFYYDLEGDILLFETILNSEPLPPLPNHEQYFPSYKKELKVCEAKAIKSSIDEPPEVELKDLPPHLEYAFLEGGNKLPVIIAKELGDEEKSALTKVLKSHKRAIAWKLSDIQGIFKFPLTLVIKKRQRSPAHMARLPTVACLSACLMLRVLFKGTKCFNGVKTPVAELKDMVRALLLVKKNQSPALHLPSEYFR
nr:reverse transcriptase domain-containing protein [Tanacetum cinerariifolium]